MAADRLSITQPALTRVIARLERQLGARLFERTPTGVRLTALGAALVEPAQNVLREIETAQGRADAARSGRAERFRVPPVWHREMLRLLSSWKSGDSHSIPDQSWHP